MTSTALLLHTYLTGPPSERRRIRLVACGTLLAFAPSVGLAFLPEVLTGAPLVAYELTFLFLLLIPLAYAYAIRRHRLLALDRFFNRSLVYLSLTALLAGFYLLFSTLLGWLQLGRLLREPLAVTLVALAVALTFQPLRARLQRWADHLFYGGWYDYQSVVQEAGRALVAVAEPAALARALLDGLTAAMKLRCACLLLADPNNEGHLSPYAAASEGCPLPPAAPHPMPSEGAVARALAVEEAVLACPQVRLWVPLRRDKGLLGALILGPKAGEETFEAEDRAILATLARETAVVVENLALMAQVQPDSDQRRMTNNERKRWSFVLGRSSANEVSPAVGRRPSAVVLAVRDDGCGFVVPPRLGMLLDEGHFGLAGLWERLAMVGGTLTVRSEPGMGTEVVAEVPLSRRLGQRMGKIWDLRPAT